jgi:hypothetical protein
MMNECGFFCDCFLKRHITLGLLTFVSGQQSSQVEAHSHTINQIDEKYICPCLEIQCLRSKKCLRPNIIGIIGGIIAFISLALPWWTMTAFGTSGVSFSGGVSIYPYLATAAAEGLSLEVTIDIWYGWAALVLVVMGGLLGIVGSLVRSTRLILVAGGLLALLSIAIFAVGLQSELSKSPLVSGWPVVALFSSDSRFMGYLNYTAYLSFGFWLALVSAIIMLVSSRRKLEVRSRTPPPQLPT